MTVHQCPKCELRFNFTTELDDHCRNDHPEFRHEYPAVPVLPDPGPAPLHVEHPPVETTHVRLSDGGELLRWLVPRERPHH